MSHKDSARRTLTGSLLLVAVLGLSVVPCPAQQPPQALSVAQTPARVGLADLEQLALQNNPTLVQATAQVEAARGRALQAGFKPNPTIGYSGEEICAGGNPGQHGIFVEQLIVTAGKLRLNRAMFSQDITQAEWQTAAQQYRVLNGVRVRFYQLLAMQKLLEVRAGLVKIADDVVTTSEELLNVGQANRPDVLQARVEARQLRVGLENARARYQASWQELAALVGKPGLPLTALQGELEAFGPALDEQAALCDLLEHSPEVHVAMAELGRSQVSVERERVEPIPNVRLQAGTQYSFETRNQQAFAQVGITLPIFDRNQGNIAAARAQVMRSQAELVRVELSLRQRFAQTYARYRTARAVVETYTRGVPGDPKNTRGALQDARDAYRLYAESFGQRRAAWPQVLVSQRTYFQMSVDYYEALEEMRRSEIALTGFLLIDGLDEPPTPGEGGRVQRRESEGGGGGPRDPIGGRGRQLEDRLGQGGN